MLQVGICVHIEPADRVVIFSLSPKGVVKYSEKLKHLAEGRSALMRDPVKDRYDILSAEFFRFGAVSVAESENGVDLGDRRTEERSALVVVLLYRVGKAKGCLFPALIKSVGNDASVIGAEVRQVAELMDEVVRFYVCPLFVCIDSRNIRHGADENYSLPLKNDRSLLLKHVVQAHCHTLYRQDVFIGISRRAGSIEWVSVYVMRLVKDGMIEFFVIHI